GKRYGRDERGLRFEEQTGRGIVDGRPQRLAIGERTPRGVAIARTFRSHPETEHRSRAGERNPIDVANDRFATDWRLRFK
ncbi:MAG: hypothetical protein KDB01_14580, partial [Planctomycetaceae bacterium]|nr:hypothetical protein [Planctomycetaceae bacterium]